MEALGDLLFELSNEERLGILLKIREKPMRLTHLSKELASTIQAISRHLSRLDEVGLTQKGVDGSFYLTPYGELVLAQLQEWKFTSQHRAYFSTHSSSHLPRDSLKQIGDLEGSKYLDNVMDFLRCIETIINYAEDHIWFHVDQYPVNALTQIEGALDRGVQCRCIEPKESVSGPALIELKPEDEHGLKRAKRSPLVEHRSIESIDVLLILSEKKSVLAFPSSKGEFDYRGFATDDKRALGWCRDLFLHYWDTAEPRVYISPTEYVRPRQTREEETDGRVVLEGSNDSTIDAQTVQDAVDNYDEVILKGSFNFGASTIIIRRSVVIKGEEREKSIPSTKIYKKGWTFPLYRGGDCRIDEHDHLFFVNGEGIDVTIENIHFTDFNYMCIMCLKGNSINIKNNRITLKTGMGRGERIHSWGDVVCGIKQYGSFPGGVIIDGNYLDFATSRMFGGFIPFGLKEDPFHRPDLLNHEYYIGWGINVSWASGKVIIENNILRNMNVRAITVQNNIASANVKIKNNTIDSEIYGAYFMDSRWAGYGIVARSAWESPLPGFHIEITDNTIKCDKLHYCGIAIIGPEFSPEGTGKLRDGIIKNNKIHLGNGSVGILVESCDGFKITNNTLSGKTYYGIGVFPQVDPQRTNLGAFENTLADNDLNGLEIKDQDEYSRSLFDKKMYPGSRAGSATAHVLLNINTNGNTVNLKVNETVIDEGKDNTIIFVENNEALARL